MTVYCSNKVLARNIRLADTFFTRFIGLMGKKSLGPEDGLLLLNCPAIHCFFMKIPIDVVYLSKEMTVLYVETVAPWKIGKRVKTAAHVLELKAGSASGEILAGDKITLS